MAKPPPSRPAWEEKEEARHAYDSAMQVVGLVTSVVYHKMLQGLVNVTSSSKQPTLCFNVVKHTGEDMGLTVLRW